jgi:hypothetical protein
MAKSKHRRKRHQARVETRHAEEGRRRDRAKADDLFERATDPALVPSALAALIAGELADSTITGRIAHARLQKGAEPAALAETARLLIADWPEAAHADGSDPGPLPPGVLAFAAVAAHASGEEDQEDSHVQALLGLARDADGKEAAKIARTVLAWTHPDRAGELNRRYLLGHPHDNDAYKFYLGNPGLAPTDEFVAAVLQRQLGINDPEALAQLGDMSDPRVTKRVRQAWLADPEVQAMIQANTEIMIEVGRRRMMPPQEVKRLTRDEAGECT